MLGADNKTGISQLAQKKVKYAPSAPGVVVEGEGSKDLGRDVAEHVQEPIDGRKEELLVACDTNSICRLQHANKHDRDQPPRDLRSCTEIGPSYRSSSWGIPAGTTAHRSSRASGGECNRVG